MERVWDFFDQLDEMVYAVDIDTYELAYMNRYLRKSLGISRHRDYVGKKCYQVLQGVNHPCEFCNNSELKEGEFCTWVHKNPVLDRQVLLKDTLIKANGRRYRLEIAIDSQDLAEGRAPYYNSRSETILNDCLQQIFSGENAQDSLEKMLAYIGRVFCCERSYIFEIRPGEIISNTYEWCASGVAPQKDFLQKVSVSAIDWWMPIFHENKVTVIYDVEEIRTLYPESYAILKPQNVHCLAAGPIISDGEVVGFIGVDNPDRQMIPMIEQFLNVIGYFAASLLRRRDLLVRLHHLSYHDQLTGAYNRHALNEHFGTMSMNSVGLIYCDITGLKRVNDAQGHGAGDRLICRCYQILGEGIKTGRIYRTGGDEFVALCPDCTEEEFRQVVEGLKERISRDDTHVAIGYAWSQSQPLDLERMMTQADRKMYQDKREYYKFHGPCFGCGEDQPSQEYRYGLPDPNWEESTLRCFLSGCRWDAEALFQSVSKDNDSSYFYLGDMQEDVVYISDNMRDDFGFSGRITHQDSHFVVDPVTEFLREHAAFEPLEVMKRMGEHTLVVGFSLNGIGEVNSTRGRVYGDRLFKKATNALMEKLSQKMTFYRMEGVRCMAVVTPGWEDETPGELVGEIRTVVDECYKSMGISVQNACSAAVMEYPHGDMGPEDLVETLLALIRVAKVGAVPNYVEYSAQSIRQVKQLSQMALTLSRDVDNHMEHFRIVVQPIVSAQGGRVIGGEALLRWNFEGQEIPPTVFVPVLERNGLIGKVGRWLFEQVVSTCVRTHVYAPNFHLGFNVSLYQLGDPELLPFMEETLKKYGVTGDQLVAELTESCLDEQPEQLNEFVEGCQRLKIKIALDDFGSGYSSLRMLLQYPSRVIKLDRSLVGEMVKSVEKMNFIRSIVYACHQFGKKVCVEGVEQGEQNQIILNTGCDMIQGFHYHRPMELGALYRLLSQETQEK